MLTDPLIRMRARDFREAVRSWTGGIFELPARRAGQASRVEIEISFGALADEITLCAHPSSSVEATSPGLRAFEVAPESRGRLAYVEQVLGGSREASARSHRRHPCKMQVLWSAAEANTASTQELALPSESLVARSTVHARLGDISRGGAFVFSDAPPPPGTPVILDLRSEGKASETPVRVPSVVSWVRRRGDRQGGFGVCFKFADSHSAHAIGALVRAHAAAESI